VADQALIDVAWIDLCPLFDMLRDHERFVEARARVALRADEAFAGARATG